MAAVSVVANVRCQGVVAHRSEGDQDVCSFVGQDATGFRVQDLFAEQNAYATCRCGNHVQGIAGLRYLVILRREDQLIMPAEEHPIRAENVCPVTDHAVGVRHVGASGNDGQLVGPGQFGERPLIVADKPLRVAGEQLCERLAKAHPEERCSTLGHCATRA
jgi:hypothetical protein